jgi:hypothetical protein
MDVGAISQLVTVALAVLAIIWHQQRAVDKLRDRMDAIKQRLARIEGFLGIGMPAAAASKAPGADLASNAPEDSEAK